MYKETKQCLECNNLFIANYKSKKFCNQSCANSYSNKTRVRKTKEKGVCLNCKKQLQNLGSKYCSLKCGAQHKSKVMYEDFILGKIVKSHTSIKMVKPFILKEQNNCCAICTMPNIWQNKEIVFVLDHIDGNSNNNTRANLRLVCPNCDSQLPTFKARNKGNGRHSRKERRLAGKSY
jgi:hypothetical protein